MEIQTNQSIFYSNKNHLPLEDVASSLLAFKAILEEIPDILEAISPGLSIQTVNIHLNEIKTGSLLQDVVVKFVWGSQEKLMDQIGELRNITHMEQIMENKKLLGCIALALILAGGIYLLKKNNAPEEQKASIQANQNTIINIGSEMANLSPEQFKSIIDGAILRNNQISKEAVKLIKPAKRDSESSITMNNDSETTITNGSIRAMPSIIPDDDSTEIIEDFSSVEVQIRAIDLDSTKRGWAAVIPSVDKKRTKMHLDPHIKVSNLIGKTKITGDVTIIFKLDEMGKKTPSLIFLRDIKNN